MTKLLRALEPRQVIFAGEAMAGGDVHSAADTLARYLTRGRKSPSPFVFLFAPNHLKTIIAYMAILKADLIAVLLDPRIGRLELQEMEDITPPAARLRIDNRQREFDFGHEVEFCPPREELDSFGDLNNVCTVMYSAADDGYAKAVLLTQENLLADARAIADFVAPYADRGTVCCSLLPQHSMYGLQCGVLTPMVAGMSLLIEDLHDLSELTMCANHIAQYDVYQVSTVPALYHLLTMAPEVKEQLSKVKYFMSGGCKLTPSVFHGFLEKFGKPIREGYGLTEASPNCAYGHDPRPESVGRALPCCAIRILDEDDREVPPGTVGEICVRGTNVMKGYYRQEAATRRALRNTWLHTGDLGRMDREGYLYVTGLRKRMINIAGRKVYPAEVERLLRLHPNTEAVEVYRRSSKLCGDGVQATVTLQQRTPDAEDAFLRWCFQNISPHKIPKRIRFR